MEEATNNSEKISVVGRMGSVFTNPSQAFINLGNFKDWLIPILIIIVVAIGRQFVMQDLENQAVKDRILRNEKIPEAQKSVIIEQMDQEANTPMAMVKAIGGIIIFSFVFTLVVAGLYLFTGNVVLGGTANYTQMLSVYALGSLIFIPETIIKSGLALSKGSINVYTSLAVLFDSSESASLIFTLANAIDIFSIWKLAVWAIGFGVVYKFSSAKSWIAVGVWYVLGILIYYGLNTLTGGMLG